LIFEKDTVYRNGQGSTQSSQNPGILLGLLFFYQEAVLQSSMDHFTCEPLLPELLLELLFIYLNFYPNSTHFFYFDFQ